MAAQTHLGEWLLTKANGEQEVLGWGCFQASLLPPPSSLLWPLPSTLLALYRSPQSSAPCPQGIVLSASALLGFALFCMTCCESLGLPPLSKDTLPPVPTPAASLNTQLLLQVPGRSAVYWRVREASPPSDWGLGELVVSSVGSPSHHRRGRQLSGSRLSNPHPKGLGGCGCLKATFGQKG